MYRPTQILYSNELGKIANTVKSSKKIFNDMNIFSNLKLRAKFKDKNFKYVETKPIKTNESICEFIDESTMYVRLPIKNNKKIYDSKKEDYKKKIKNDSVKFSDFLDVQKAKEDIHLKVGFENKNKDFVIEAAWKTQGKFLETYHYKIIESEIQVTSHNTSSSLSIFVKQPTDILKSGKVLLWKNINITNNDNLPARCAKELGINENDAKIFCKETGFMSAKDLFSFKNLDN